MAYTLQAIVAKSGAVSELPEKLELIGIGGGMDLIPLGAEALKAHNLPFCPLTDEGQECLPLALSDLCERLSARCALAYIEVEIFGGAGTQAHALFSDGKAVGPVVVSDSAVNQALRSLGVHKGASVDEFEAVGLGLQRDTDDWLA
ncbi:MAG: hypothetical protein ABI410_02195 [Rhodoferax sp.]|uniref:hypothetical protein n=1 Tax=Rhodoferax sp. TaxID=50421 RepID=UPI003266E9CC